MKGKGQRVLVPNCFHSQDLLSVTAAYNGASVDCVIDETDLFFCLFFQKFILCFHYSLKDKDVLK